MKKSFKSMKFTNFKNDMNLVLHFIWYHIRTKPELIWLACISALLDSYFRSKSKNILRETFCFRYTKVTESLSFSLDMRIETNTKPL